MATASGGFIVRVGDYDIFADEAHKLGFGALGTVYSGTNRFNDKIQVAAKKMTVETEFLDHREHLKEVELLLHTIRHHENIIKVHEFTTIDYEEDGIPMTDIWMVMDKGELGNLKKFARRKELSLAEKVDIIFQCVLAVHHMHHCEPEAVTHRDIKPENFVLTKVKDHVVVKLVDFGHSRTVQRVSGRSVTMKSLAGTECYWAPEQVDADDGYFPHDKSVDIFSLALTILALLDCSKGVTMTPFALRGKSLGVAMRQMMKDWSGLGSGFTPNIEKPGDGPAQKALKRILGLMLQAEPKGRISITEVLERLTAVVKDFPEIGKIPSVRTSPSHTGVGAASEESSAQPTAAGPSRAQPKAAGPSHAQPKAAGPSRTEHASAGPSRIKEPEMRSAEASMHGLDISDSSTSSGSKSGSGTKSKRRITDNRGSVQAGRPTADRGTITARTAGRRSNAIDVQEIARHKLSYTVNWIPGLSDNGDILLAEKYTSRFSLFKYEGNKYTSSRQRDLPNGVYYHCYKAVSRHGDLFFQHRKDTDTLCCSSDGTVITTLQHKGDLLDSINDTLVYECGTLGERDWSIEIHECPVRGGYQSDRSASERQASRPVLTLKPPGSHTWGRGLSICCIENTYVVVESLTKSMDTFNCNGEHIHRRELTYTPAWPYGVTAWSGHIVVAALTPPALHLYTGSGEEIMSKTHAQLGLDEGAYVYGIRCDSNGVLHMCIGDRAWTINYLHAYQLTEG